MPHGPANTSIILAAINAIVFAAIIITGWGSSKLVSLLALSKWGACYDKTNPGSYYPSINTPETCAAIGNWQPGALDGAWWQILTSAFTHVSITHIIFNMIALLALGPQIEELLGRTRFLIIYFGSAITGSIAVLLLNHGGITLGASGAIFGLMGALLAYVLRTKQNPSQILSWLGLNFVITVLGAGVISWQGHLGGFLGGTIIGAILIELALARLRRRGYGVRNPSDW